MGFSQLFSGRRKLAFVVLVAVAVAAWAWLGPFRGNGDPAAMVAGNAPADPAAGVGGKTAFPDADTRLEELFRRQQVLGQQAGVASEPKKMTAAPPGNATTPTGKAGADAQQKPMEMLSAARDEAVREIMSAGPGDGKKVVAAVEKLDAQMRAAGMPSVIDMPKFRQMMISADRIQDISKRLAAEQQKGRLADPAKIQSLLNELGAVQAAMPRSPYNMEAIERMRKSGS